MYLVTREYLEQPRGKKIGKIQWFRRTTIKTSKTLVVLLMYVHLICEYSYKKKKTIRFGNKVYKNYDL